MRDVMLITLGLIVGWLFRRAWAEASAEELLDAKRGRKR
jgi:hypothetical protein